MTPPDAATPSATASPSDTVIVLVMHGEPPRDLPREAISEYFVLHEQMASAPPDRQASLRERLQALDHRIRHWPRTPANDPFYAGSMALAAALEQAAGMPVIVAFNEFCAPALPEALDRAAASASRVLVVSPMMTRGGSHAEGDIPRAVERARQRHPGVRFVYAWPYDVAEVAAFLARHVRRFALEPR